MQKAKSVAGEIGTALHREIAAGARAKRMTLRAAVTEACGLWATDAGRAAPRRHAIQRYATAPTVFVRGEIDEETLWAFRGACARLKLSRLEGLIAALMAWSGAHAERGMRNAEREHEFGNHEIRNGGMGR